MAVSQPVPLYKKLLALAAVNLLAVWMLFFRGSGSVEVWTRLAGEIAALGMALLVLMRSEILGLRPLMEK